MLWLAVGHPVRAWEEPLSDEVAAVLTRRKTGV